jgi:hypothetical protein
VRENWFWGFSITCLLSIREPGATIELHSKVTKSRGAIVKAGAVVLAVAVFLIAVAAYFRARSSRRAASLGADLVMTDQSRYKPGQVWSLRIPEAPLARLTILRVESLPGADSFVHVAVSGVPVAVGHMPFSESAIDKSVGDLVDTVTVGPEALDGYQEWRTAFDSKGAGVFTITVPEALELVG